MQKPVLNSLTNIKHAPLCLKSAPKKSLLVKQKPSSLNLTTDETEDQIKLRLTEPYSDVEMEKLEVTFKKNSNKPKIKNQEITISDKGILIHSLSDLFRSIDKME